MITRFSWLALGLFCVTCGLVGVVLPLLPTTPFLLVAAYAFARSSPRLHHWLASHSHFGPLIRNWQQYGAISRRAKQLAVLSMALSLVLSWQLAAPTWLIAVQAIALIGAGTYVLSRPTAADRDAR
jgi:uncharacterized membrane protein YbaN (DUF454 family)